MSTLRTLRANRRGAGRRGVRRLAGLLAAGAVLVAAPRSSRAESPGDAIEIFREGVRLRQEGKLDEACARFAESHRLEPTAGKLLNVAHCHEREGKLATARAEFLSASELYRARGQEGGVAECRRRAALLEPRLSRLMVRVGRPVEGLVVKDNGRVVGPSQLGVPFFADPGEHVIVAEAPGHLPFRASSRVGPREGSTAVVDVPALAELEGPPATAARRVAGYVVGGVGVAALGAGVAFGAMALSSNAKAEDACPSVGGCSPEVATYYRDRANAQAWGANLGVGLGLLGLAAGGYLILTAPSGRPAGAGAAAGAGLTVAAHPTGLQAVLRF
jgi:hypothetical protein